MKIRKISRQGNILTENIVFIILNLVFLMILILFLFSKIESTAILEEKYAKQIALIIDSADPGMTIQINMGDALSSKEEGIDEKEIVKIIGNQVYVKLSEKGGYYYSFFNNINVNHPYPDGDNYIIITSEGGLNE